MSWVEEKGNWKWFDENSKQLTGWFLSPEDNRYYYLCSDTVQTEWFQDSDGRWYYFSPKKQIIDGKQYYLGQMITGWIEYNGKQCYLYDGSRPDLGIYRGQLLQDGTYTMPYDSNKKYTFDKDGYLVENNNGISDKGAEFIASWEGFYSKAYADPYYGASVKDYWTIGFGTCYCSNPSAFPNGLNSTCTRQEALKWLKEEADKCYNKIKTDLTNKGIFLSSHQMDALSSFSFNCGVNALFGSSLYRYIIQGGTDANKIKTYFRMWNKANGQVSKGLDRRRIAEAEMFSYGVYNNN